MMKRLENTMKVPDELVVFYSTTILIPGYLLKIKLQVEENSALLNYLLKAKSNSESTQVIGLIPKIDFGKVDNVIGTVGLVRSVIQIGEVPEEFVLLVQGLCRFKLDATISKEPLKICKIIVIENFKELIGDEKEITKLTAEFEKVFTDFLTYTDSGINPYTTANTKIFFKRIPLYQFVEYCLKNFINLTPADTYEILKATSLNHLLKCLINWLKRETVRDKHSRYGKNGLVPVAMPLTFLTDSVINKNEAFFKKARLSPELTQLETAIKNAKMPIPVFDTIMKEFKRLQETNSYHADYPILLDHVNYVVNLPWDKSTQETLDLDKAKNVLQLNHYGMESVKKRILQFIAVRILNPERRGPILCFIGPPGVGKTTIAKTIADSLNRTFKRLSLGGINHFSDIKGHRKTYIGAMPGCIIQAVNQAHTKNPIILLDEIDKMYKGSSGDPAAALLEVLDPEQNNSFVDSYVNVPFDLSQVMFISTANNSSNIPQTLLDRMEVIHIGGYTEEEKLHIAENYLFPKILKDHKLHEINITICTDTIKDIIQKYTCEAGVRELQRKLESICCYIAVKIVENEEMKNYVITPESLFNILGGEIYHGLKSSLVEQCSGRVGVAIGLAWTPVGGIVQVIETSRLFSGNEKNCFVLTGLAGQTLKESVEIALNWIQSFAVKNEIEVNNYCVHVHLPKAGDKKDGPSAGITVVSALISLLWKVPLRPMVAMTGEISLKGYVLPVGGVKEKILAAYNSGIRTVIIPDLNMKDVILLPNNIRDVMNIIPAKHLEDVLNIVIPGGLEFLQNPTANMLPTSKI